MTENKDIHSYQLIRWKSFMSISTEYFTTLLKITSLKSSFNDDFSVRIGERSRELNQLELRLFLLLTPFILLLGAFDSEFIQRITIFGITMSKDNGTQSVLLLVSAVLVLFTSAASVVSAYYLQVLKAYVSVDHDERIVSYYIHQFQWSIGSLFDGLKDNQIKHSFIYGAVNAALAASLLCVIVVIKVLILTIFVGAIISTQGMLGVPVFFNILIVIVAVCAIFDISCVLLTIPLPFMDYSNIAKIEELKKTNPSLAEEIELDIAKRGLDRDRRNLLALQAIVLLSFVIVPTYVFLGADLVSRYEMVPQILLALLLMLAVVSPILDKIEVIILGNIFKTAEKELKFKRYVSSKKWMLKARLISAAVVGFGVFKYFH